MWQCPKCEQEFKNANQDHYCGELPKTIDAYIAAQPESVQPLLNLVRDTIHATLPYAEERISWRMPTYWRKHNIIHFASFKKHIGLYPGDKAIGHRGTVLLCQARTHLKFEKGRRGVKDCCHQIV